MTKKIKRIVVTRTIVYDRDCHPQPFETDEQFNDWVREVVDDDFKYHSNFTEDFSIHKNNEHPFGYLKSY